MLNLLLSRETYQDIIEMWLRFTGSYEDLAQAYGCDIRTIRTRFHRAAQRLQTIVRERHIQESDLRGWLQAYQLVLEEEWGEKQQAFFLRDYIKGEAYANTFGGQPFQGRYVSDDDFVPDDYLSPSYWE